MVVASLELEVGRIFILFMFSQHMLVHSVEGQKKCPTSIQCPKCSGQVLFPPLPDGSQPQCDLLPINCTQLTPMVQLFDQQGIAKWYSVMSIEHDTITILGLDLEHNPQNNGCEAFPNSVPFPSFVSFPKLNLTLFNCNPNTSNHPFSADRDKNHKKCPGFKINCNLSNHDGSITGFPPPQRLVIWVPRPADCVEEKEPKQLLEMVSANATVQISSGCLDCNDQVGPDKRRVPSPKNDNREHHGSTNGNR